ncbi:hypothetical protein B9Z19DRAFT_1197741 [Tuber borchii]|uniref:Uncharacterized protein n=1 Tax=Tuber borchii TaxID=42251 RepID=A0A2T6Z9E8_TUBBO|nr:hypothetical protein B9Z19DRAFT_1197741 [Tuber borchii]
MKPFSDSFLRYPIYPQSKGHLHTTISHGATEFSEGGVLIIPGALGMGSRSPFTTAFYAIPSVHRQKHIPIQAFSMALQSLLKGESICQIPGALGMRSRSPFTTAFYAIPSVHRQRDVSIQAFPVALQNSGGVRHAIMKPFYDGVLHHPICPPPKGHPHTSIFHGATESSEGGIPGALGIQSWSTFMTVFYTIQAVHRQKGVSIEGVSIALSP